MTWSSLTKAAASGEDRYQSERKTPLSSEILSHALTPFASPFTSLLLFQKEDPAAKKDALKKHSCFSYVQPVGPEAAPKASTIDCEIQKGCRQPVKDATVLLKSTVFVHPIMFGADYSVSAHPCSPGCLLLWFRYCDQAGGLVALGPGRFCKREDSSCICFPLKRITGPDGHD